MGNFLEAAVAAEAMAEREEIEAEKSKPSPAEAEKEEEDSKTPISVRDYIAKNKSEVEKQSGLKHMLKKFQTTDIIENTPNDSKVISMRKCIEKLIESPVIMTHLTSPQGQNQDPASAMHANMNQFRNRAVSHGAREGQLQYSAQRQSEATGRESQSEAMGQSSYETDKPRPRAMTYGGAGKSDPLRGLERVVETSSYIPNMKQIAAAGDPVWQGRYKEDPGKLMPKQPGMRYHQAIKAEPQEGAMHHPPTEHSGPYLTPKSEHQASRYPPLEGLRPAPPGPSIVHGTVEPMKGYPHAPERKPWSEASNPGPRGWERDPRWHQSMERPQMTSKMMYDNARPRIGPEDPKARMFSDDPRTRMVPDPRMTQDDPRTRMVPEGPRARMVPDDRSRMVIEDPRSRVMPDDPRARMFMNEQRSKFGYEDPRARMMSEEQRSRAMSEDQASRLRIEENSPKIFSSPAIDQAYKRGLLARNQRRQSFTDMNIVSPKTQADIDDSYASRPRSKTLDQQHLRQQYLIHRQRMGAMKQNENMLSPGKRPEVLEPSDTVGAHLLRLVHENPMMKYERPPSSSTSDVYHTSSQPQFTRALPPMAIRKNEDKAHMAQENLPTHRVDLIRAIGGIGDEQINFNANAQMAYSKEGSTGKKMEEKVKIKPSDVSVDRRQPVQDEVSLRKAALAAGPVGALIYAELMAQKVEESKNVEKLSPGGGTAQNVSPYRKEPQEAMKMPYQYQHYNQPAKPPSYQTASGDMVMMSSREGIYEGRESSNPDFGKTLHYYPAQLEHKKGPAVSQYSQENKSEEKEETQTQVQRKRPGGECPLDLSVKKAKNNEDVQEIREAAFRREYEKFLKQQQEQNKKAFKPRDFYAARHFDNDSQDASYEENYITTQQSDLENNLTINKESLPATGLVTNQDINLEAEIPANDVLFIECKLCGSTYGSLPNFRRHFTKLHSGRLRRDDMFVHTISAAKNARAKQLETTDEQSPLQQGNTNIEGLTCSQCGDQAQGDFTQKNWLCKECYEQFSDRDSLQRHLTVAHGLENKFRCSNCQRVEERSICQATPDSTIPNEDSQQSDMDTKRSDVSCQANISTPKTDEDPENYSQEHTRFLKFKYPIKKMVTEKMKRNEASQEEAPINPRKRPLEWSENNQSNVRSIIEETEQAPKRVATENVQQHNNQTEHREEGSKQRLGSKDKPKTADDILQDVITKTVVSYHSSDESSKESFKESMNDRKLLGPTSENPYAQKDYPGPLHQQQTSPQSALDYSPKLLQRREHRHTMGSQSWDNFDRTRFYRRPMYAGQYHVKDAIASMVTSEFEDSQDKHKVSDIKQEPNSDMNTGRSNTAETQEWNQASQDRQNLGERLKSEDKGKELESREESRGKEGQSSTVGCIVARLIESSIMKPSVDNSPRKKKIDRSFHEFLSSNSPKGSTYDNYKESQGEYGRDGFQSVGTEEGANNESRPPRSSSSFEHQKQQNVNITAQTKGGMQLPSSVYSEEHRLRTGFQSYSYNKEPSAGMRLQTIPCSMEQRQGAAPGGLPSSVDQNWRAAPQIYAQTSMGMHLPTKQNIQEQKNIVSQEIKHQMEVKAAIGPQNPFYLDKSSSDTSNKLSETSLQLPTQKPGSDISNKHSETGLQLSTHLVEQKDITALSQKPVEVKEQKLTLDRQQHPKEQVPKLSDGDRSEGVNREQLIISDNRGNESPQKSSQEDQTERCSKSELQNPEFAKKTVEPEKYERTPDEPSDFTKQMCDTKVDSIEQQDSEMEKKELQMNVENNEQSLKSENDEIDMKIKNTEQKTENMAEDHVKVQNLDQEKAHPLLRVEENRNTQGNENVCQTAEERKEEVKRDEGNIEAESGISGTKPELENPTHRDESSGIVGSCTEQTGNADCQDKSGEESEREAQVTECMESAALEQLKSYEKFDDGMESDSSGELVIDLEYNENEVKGQAKDDMEAEKMSVKRENVSVKCDLSVDTQNTETKTDTQVLLSQCDENSEEKSVNVDKIAAPSGSSVNNESEAVRSAEQSGQTNCGENITQLQTTNHSFQEQEPLPSSTDGATDPREGLPGSVTDMKQCSVVLCDASSNPQFQRFIEKK